MEAEDGKNGLLGGRGGHRGRHCGLVGAGPSWWRGVAVGRGEGGATPLEGERGRIGEA